MAKRFTVPEDVESANDNRSQELYIFNRTRSDRPEIHLEFQISRNESMISGAVDLGGTATGDGYRPSSAVSVEGQPVAPPITITCDCRSTCQRKGCPCRNARKHCQVGLCTCGSKKKPCQNRLPTDEPSSVIGLAESCGGDTRGTVCAGAPHSSIIDVKATLSNLNHEDLLEMAAKVFEDRKSLLIDLISQKMANAVEETNQPSFSVVPSWCKCLQCREMPTQKERKCCKRRNCITKDQTFYDICLNGNVLEVAINSRCDIRVDIPSQDRKTMRHTAYRQFVMWQHGPLGAGNRVVIPSCCVWKIRDKYPSPNNMYTGYKDH